MNAFFTEMKSSFSEMKKLKNLTTMALLIALSVVLHTWATIPLGPTLKLGFGFIATAIMGMMFGPFWATIAAGAVDILQYLIKPTGEFFPGFTLTAMLAGLIFGLFLYKNRTSLPRLIISKTLVNLLLNILLNTLFLKILYGKAFWALAGSRFIKNLALLPIEVVILFLLLPQIVKIRKLIDK